LVACMAPMLPSAFASRAPAANLRGTQAAHLRAIPTPTPDRSEGAGHQPGRAGLPLTARGEAVEQFKPDCRRPDDRVHRSARIGPEPAARARRQGVPLGYPRACTSCSGLAGDLR
jgi:hypothetical protein